MTTENFKGGFWFALVLLLALDSSATAEQSVRLSEAVQPIADGVPEVAIVRLRVLLAQKIPEEERISAIAKLGEALVASGEFAEALSVLSEDDLRQIPEARFFRAQALGGLSRWAEALPLYQACAAELASPIHADALFGQAEALRALGRIEEALQIFSLVRRDELWRRRAEMRSVELLLTKGDPAGATRLLDAIQPTSAAERSERRLLRGRSETMLNHDEKAARLFASILKNPTGATHSVLVATLFAVAEAHLRMGTPATGDDFLEDFIEHQPRDSDLAAIFAKLDQLYAAEKKPSRHELARWSRDPSEPRRALSRWYLARAEMRLGHRDLALSTFALLRVEHPSLSALAEAFFEYAQLEMQDGRFADAAEILEVARELHPSPEMVHRINLLAGHIQYAAKRFDEAGQTFQHLAHSSQFHAQEALFDASLAWLEAGDARQFAVVSQELKESGADEEMRGDLVLEEGLVQAAKGESKANESLRTFLREFPKHRRVSEAWVALAELAFHAAPPRVSEARQDLAHAVESQPTALANERADYLSIWIEEAEPAPNEEKVIGLANQFLQKHEGSSLLPEVRLKLAEIYYRRQDFAGAQTQFEILARKNAAGPLAEKAEFFAAQSSMQSMSAGSLEHALVLFDAVVKRNGELKWAARNEQAVIERKLGKPEDALTLYDEVLKGDAQPAEKREALCGKGDILYELGAKDRENYKRALDFYGQLAAQPDVASHWRNQALFKKGMCLEKLEAPAEALATFYEIIEDRGKPERRRDFFWFYKAGFNAARLLEENSKWQPAAAIYEKLAFAGGGRSEEAKARLNRLRLEHFLWDQ